MGERRVRVKNVMGKMRRAWRRERWIRRWSEEDEERKELDRFKSKANRGEKFIIDRFKSKANRK